VRLGCHAQDRRLGLPETSGAGMSSRRAVSRVPPEKSQICSVPAARHTAEDYPLLPVSSKPRTKYRWATKNSTASGNSVTRLAAISRLAQLPSND